MGWKNRALTTAAAGGALYAGISALMAWGMTRSARRKQEETPATVGLAYENVRFPSRDDGLSLAGWLIPPPGCTDMNDALAQRWIVLAHGFGSHSSDPATGLLGLARDLFDQGYGVFLFDFRASGRSAGTRNSAGFYERLDLLGAVDYLADRGADRTRIGVLGHSMGAAVALMSCSGPGTAAAVVADSSFADLWLMIRRAQSGIASPLRLANPGMNVAARTMYGIEIDEISPARSLSVAEVPVLIIHGEDDRVVPISHARLLSRAIGMRPGETQDSANRLWIVPESGHLEAYRNFPKEYVGRVSEFFDAHLSSPVRVGTAN